MDNKRKAEIIIGFILQDEVHKDKKHKLHIQISRESF